MRDLETGKFDPLCVCGHHRSSHAPLSVQPCMATCDRQVQVVGHYGEVVFGPASKCSCIGFKRQAHISTRTHEGKRDWLLLPLKAAAEVVDVLAFGDSKEDREPGDWRKRDKDYFLRKALRHLIARINGEEKDPESGKDHLAHVAANVMCALEVP